MNIKPCSRVFDDDPHEPHVYYHAGHDVKCMGYSPLRVPMSDVAETPEQFFGLHPITKAPLYTKPDLVINYEGEKKQPVKPSYTPAIVLLVTAIVCFGIALTLAVIG